MSLINFIYAGRYKLYVLKLKCASAMWAFAKSLVV